MLSLALLASLSLLTPAVISAPASTSLTYTWKPNGCLVDSWNRALGAYLLTDESMTTLKCQQACQSRNYLYSGLEWGTQCFCANSVTYGESNSGKLALDAECNTPCAGNTTENCGGGFRLWTYKYTLVPATSAIVNVKVPISTSLHLSTSATVKLTTTASSSIKTPASSSSGSKSSSAVSSSSKHLASSMTIIKSADATSSSVHGSPNLPSTSPKSTSIRSFNAVSTTRTSSVLSSRSSVPVSTSKQPISSASSEALTLALSTVKSSSTLTPSSSKSSSTSIKPTTTSSAKPSSGTSTTSSSPRSTGKAGLAWNYSSGTNFTSSTSLSHSKISWTYNWDSSPIPATPLDILEYVPMAWGADSNRVEAFARNSARFASLGAKNLLSFNEPDMPSQYGGSGMTPSQAATTHQSIFNTTLSSLYRIGTPAVARGSKSWLQQWVTACNGKCAYDFVPLHFYGTDAGDMITYIKDFITTFGKPVWVTEYACTNYGATTTTCTLDQAKAFQTQVINYMENEPMVERYAAFGMFEDMASGGNANGMMNSDGSANELGVLYATT